MFTATQQAPAKPVVFWIIWAAILNGLFMIAYFAAPRPVAPELRVDEANLPFIAISIVAGMISLGIRFMVIPKLNQVQSLMIAMVIALAIAEGSAIAAMFFISAEYHTTRIFMFAIGVICVLMNAPIYTNRLSNDGSTLEVDP